MKSEQVMRELATGVAATAGLDPAVIGTRRARQGLELRMRATGHADAETYLALYREDKSERALYLEELLVRETSFFRDAAVFREMLSWLLDRLERQRRALRLLSAPCSTGEEPYSLAAMLLQAGVPAERFTIDGLDISDVAIRHGQNAVYGKFSLRNLNGDEAARFLEPVADGSGWSVHAEVRARVRLRQCNLLDENAIDGPYDLICSRNLLLYQNETARQELLVSLQAALAPRGRLVIGTADWGRDFEPLFVMEKPSQAFAFRARTPEELVERSGAPAPAPPSAPTPALAPTAQRAAAPEQISAGELYRQAVHKLAEGQEEEAEQLCRQALYLETGHLAALQMLSRIRSGRSSQRMRQALLARLRRHQLRLKEAP